MQFLSLITAAAVAVAVAVPADLVAKEVNQPKAVLLEMGREYSYEELEHLRANAPAEPWYQNLAKEDNKLSKRMSSVGLSVDATWTCPVAGPLERLVVGRVTYFEGATSDHNDARWAGIQLVDSWTLGPATTFPSADGTWPTSNTAVHNFCLHFTNQICTYHLEAGFVQLVRNFEENPTAFGDGAPSAPTLTEVCLTIHQGAQGACPAVGGATCVLNSFE